MRNAKVHVSVMGDEAKQSLCLRGLQSSVGFLQSKIGNRIDTRYIPRIKFELDRGLQNAMIVTRILDEVLPKTSSTESFAAEDDSSDYDGAQYPTH
jgi:ribosome-binding factor A